MKFKHIVATMLIGVVGATSVAFGATVFQNKKVNYAINLIANGTPYTVQTQALKPFTTDDGYTYLSVRSLSELGLVDINYSAATKTVTVNPKQVIKPGEVQALNDRILMLTNENERYRIENEKLKQQLSNKGSSSSSSSSSSGDRHLKDLDSGDRRTLERDIARDLQRVKLSTDDYGRSIYEGDVSINRDRVRVTLSDTSRLDVQKWNDIVKGRRVSYFEDDMYEALESEVLDVVKDYLKGYYNYEITITVQASKDDNNNNLQDIVDASYKENGNKFRVSVDRYTE
ncbi:MAG: hypothetical protein Q3993_01675 [Filifactor alocis]|nr:hypothetical protein [Filifactor alocis]